MCAFGYVIQWSLKGPPGPEVRQARSWPAWVP